MKENKLHIARIRARKTYCFVMTLTLVSVSPLFAVEGEVPRGAGQWGVNRRVTSDVEFVRNKGTFTADFGLPCNAAGNVTAATNSQNSSPSFYLGGSGPGAGIADEYEIDAGLQWDWSNQPASPRGWVAFISRNAVQVNPRVFDSTNGWVPWRGTGRVYDLDYSVTQNGAVKLTVSDLGTFFWNQSPPPQNPNSTIWPSVGVAVMDPQRLDQNRVKRVVAMTRDAPFTHGLDGSYLVSTFRNGKIFSTNGAEIGWSWLNTNGSPTGYDAPGGTTVGPGPFSNLGPIDAIRAGTRTRRSRFKVDFNRLDGAPQNTEIIPTGRGSGSYQATENGNSRYNSETVRINLRTFQSLAGRRVRRGP